MSDETFLGRVLTPTGLTLIAIFASLLSYLVNGGFENAVVSILALYTIHSIAHETHE
jgi:hypothetical protein